jgi:hypothetical protein
VRRLLADGRSLVGVAAELGVSRNAVRRFARAVGPEDLLVRDGTGRRARCFDDHADYLRQRWNADCANAAQVWQEIRARYPGGATEVRRYLARD